MSRLLHFTVYLFVRTAQHKRTKDLLNVNTLEVGKRHVRRSGRHRCVEANGCLLLISHCLLVSKHLGVIASFHICRVLPCLHDRIFEDSHEVSLAHKRLIFESRVLLDEHIEVIFIEACLALQVESLQACVLKVIVVTDVLTARE